MINSDDSGPATRQEAVRFNEQNTSVRKSPVSRLSDWLLPHARAGWAQACARFNSAGTLTDLSKVPVWADSLSVVSLDFFDTLVTRPVEPPAYVLGKVAEISVTIINRCTGMRLSEDEYLRGRYYCELALRAENANAYGLDRESSLPGILNRLLHQLGINDAALTAALVAAEAELEGDLLTLNPGALDLLVHLKNSGKKVLVLSDTYLAADHLNQIGQKLGISGYIDKIYASGDIGLGKHSGRLFQHVLKEEDVLPEDVFHIGDNRRSDFKVPTTLGINAKWLYQKRHLRRRLHIERRLRGNPEKFVLRFIRDRTQQLYTRSEVLERHLFNSVAPAMYCMAYRSLKDCVSLGITNLYFLAREGISLKVVYELLMANHPEFRSHNFRTKVLYCSRASTICARFGGTHDIGNIAATVLSRCKKISYQNLLTSWNVPEEELNYRFEVPPEVESLSGLEALFAGHPEFAAAFETYLFKRKADLHGYLKQEGVLDGPCAFVDVGWGGTIQQNIAALGAGAEIYGLYLGTDQRFESRNLRGYLFSPADYRAGAVLKSAPLTETILSVSGLGTTVSYESVEGKFLPRFKETTGPASSCESARDRVFSDFYDMFLMLTRQLCIPTQVLIEAARKQYFKLVCHPSLSFVRAIQDLEFEFDWGDETRHKLVLMLTAKDLLSPSRLLVRLWKCPWLFGTLKANHLGLLNAPLTWLLGHEEKVSLRSLRKHFPWLPKIS